MSITCNLLCRKCKILIRICQLSLCQSRVYSNGILICFFLRNCSNTYKFYKCGVIMSKSTANCPGVDDPVNELHRASLSVILAIFYSFVQICVFYFATEECINSYCNCFIFLQKIFLQAARRNLYTNFFVIQNLFQNRFLYHRLLQIKYF